jgi:ABC-type nitrate/sulfonate/bicarbonate transport system permease component
MNSNTLLNRAEILMYSSLISVMSGINHLKSKILQVPSLPRRQPLDGEAATSQSYRQVLSRSMTEVWKTIEQVLLSLLLWAILGFAAGFLMGMLQPG